MTCDECYWNKKKLDALSEDYNNLKKNANDVIDIIKKRSDELVKKNERDIDDYNGLVKRHNDLMNNNRSKYDGLVGEYNELLSKNRKNIEDYNILVNKHNSLLEESTASAKNYNDLRNKYSDLYDNDEELKRKNNSLQVLVNNKDNELEKKEREIGELKGLLDKSRKEAIGYKLKNKEKRLETFIQQLGINREKARDLCKVYQKLTKAQMQENFDQNIVMLMEDEIEKIKNELLGGGWFKWKVSIENTQKFCRKSEKIAKLLIEQEKLYQEQYEARQEVPVN